MRMIRVLYPDAVDMPTPGYIGRAAKQVGGWGRLAELLWAHSARPPTGDVLAYILASNRNSTPARASPKATYEELRALYVSKRLEDFVEY